MLLAGCSIGGIKYKESITKEDTEISRIYIEQPSLSGISDEDFQAEINSIYEQRTLSWTEDFKGRIPQHTNEKSELSSVCDLKFCDNDFISIVTEKNVYMGGAHGNLWRTAENIDLKYKKKLMLEDLFMDKDYIEFLNLRIDELIQENSEKYSDLWQKPQIGKREQENFYIYENNIIIYYQPYDLSYYAKGIIEFPISIESLRGYIKPEYTKRLS